jgi:hypothetical protein
MGSKGIRSGIWKGPDGGGMAIKVNGKRVEGVYVTKVGRPQAHEQFDLVGVTDGNLIGFSVLWNEAGEEKGYSLTSWAGRFTQDQQNGDKIVAVWHLCQLFHDSNNTQPTEIWSSFLNFAAEYTFRSDSTVWREDV